MRNRHVITFLIIVNISLPVNIDFVCGLSEVLVCLEVIFLSQLDQRPQVLAQGNGCGYVQVDEDPVTTKWLVRFFNTTDYIRDVLPMVYFNGEQRQAFLEILAQIQTSGLLQFTRFIVQPAMITIRIFYD